MTAKEEFLRLVDKYTDGTANAKELEALDRYYLLFADQPEVTGQLSEKAQAQLAQRMEDGLMARVHQIGQPATTIRLWPRITAAASILLVLGTGAYFMIRQKQHPQWVADVAPFSKQAILKTGHGKILVLDSNHKGTLAQYANTNIQQTKGDQVIYTHSSADNKLVFDTLQVPAGAKPYHLQLADGSEIVVNVASTLRYPEGFRQNANQLELIEGEAFFDIKHDSAKPVTVKAKNQQIADIGTGFDVSAYNNEPESRTTLAEGKIKVNERSIQPGYQAVITANSVAVVKANLVQVLAWKDGFFRFNGEHIQAVMRELARAYNIEVVYQGQPTDVGFYLRISRSKNISEVLKLLERTNTVHFKIEGRRVTVLGKK